MSGQYYSFNEFLSDVRALEHKISAERFDGVISIARGGIFTGLFIAEALEINNFYIINAVHYRRDQKLQSVEIKNIPALVDEKNVLVCDEIADSGETLRAVTQLLSERYKNTTFKTAVLFQKESAAFTADYFVKPAFGWIEFFWEKELNPALL
ncbi:MAG: phosphoribosyltransferase [Helicobacteraceae bacterium]|jgi:hypoxanthine phosphoribosyltransferase|nr:phosphoribosyltransferase [Helicobacteraceae bacterium]